MRKLSLSDLPVELVGAVVHQIVSIGDLLRLRVVNHTISTYATPRAFHTLHIVNTEKGVSGQKFIMESPPLALLVKRLVIHCEAGQGENKLLNTGKS
jgi:hypothetical protein